MARHDRNSNHRGRVRTAAYRGNRPAERKKGMEEGWWQGGGMTLLIFQMAIVVATSLVCGQIACRFGQARVIGEIGGGILIGPSVLGRIAPHI